MSARTAWHRPRLALQPSAPFIISATTVHAGVDIPQPGLAQHPVAAGLLYCCEPVSSILLTSSCLSVHCNLDQAGLCAHCRSPKAMKLAYISCPVALGCAGTDLHFASLVRHSGYRCHLPQTRLCGCPACRLDPCHAYAAHWHAGDGRLALASRPVRHTAEIVDVVLVDNSQVLGSWRTLVAGATKATPIHCCHLVRLQ